MFSGWRCPAGRRFARSLHYCFHFGGAKWHQHSVPAALLRKTRSIEVLTPRASAAATSRGPRRHASPWLISSESVDFCLSQAL